MTRIATTASVKKLVRFEAMASTRRPCEETERRSRRTGALPAEAWRDWFERQTF
jgi:hypothetical protein